MGTPSTSPQAAIQLAVTGVPLDQWVRVRLDMTDEAIVDGDLAADGKLSDAAVLKRLIQQHWLRHKAKGGAG